MTAQIFNLKGEPIQPIAAPSRVGPLSGQLRLVSDASSPEEIGFRRLRAAMHLRNAIDLCREEYGPVRLAAMLAHAAEQQFRLSEVPNEPA
jgi:hypothetical protein